jgi:hypothetical protein
MSKITDCFMVDNTEGAYLAVYEAEREVHTYYATRFGVQSQRGKACVRVPLYDFTPVELEDRCVLLLLEAAKAGDWQNRSAYEEADWDFQKRNLPCCRILTSSDHHLIPLGCRIAVSDPEAVGRVVESGSQRGVVLFNPKAVIGYRYVGKTSFEVVNADFLAA